MHGGRLRSRVSSEELSEAWNVRELELAGEAADLVAADIRATTRLSTPNIQVRRDDDSLIVSFNGDYQSTPHMFSMRAPESICEVAENLRDHVMDEVWTVWPVCPSHGVCPTGNHVVADIGLLGDENRDRLCDRAADEVRFRCSVTGRGCVATGAVDREGQLWAEPTSRSRPSLIVVPSCRMPST